MLFNFLLYPQKENPRWDGGSLKSFLVDWCGQVGLGKITITVVTDIHRSVDLAQDIGITKGIAIHVDIGFIEPLPAVATEFYIGDHILDGHFGIDVNSSVIKERRVDEF